MKYKRFEDLPVWKDAVELAVQVFALTAQPEFKSKYSLKDQIERAAVSVSNNIAEGFERGTNKELLMFLYIARGSAGETRSMCCLFFRLPDLVRLAGEIRKIHSKAESCSRQLKSWAEAIQNSNYKGERYVTESLKRADLAARQREEFLKDLARIRDENIARTRAAAANRSKLS
jgi:four helix bundle protein